MKYLNLKKKDNTTTKVVKSDIVILKNGLNLLSLKYNVALKNSS